jgi:hypothetical protein
MTLEQKLPPQLFSAREKLLFDKYYHNPTNATAVDKAAPLIGQIRQLLHALQYSALGPITPAFPIIFASFHFYFSLLFLQGCFLPANNSSPHNLFLQKLI